jgi:hypothetical protein
MKAMCIAEKSMCVGRLFSVHCHPTDPYIIAAGGDQGIPAVWEADENPVILEHFQSRIHLPATTNIYLQRTEESEPLFPSNNNNNNDNMMMMEQEEDDQVMPPNNNNNNNNNQELEELIDEIQHSNQEHNKRQKIKKNKKKKGNK